MPATDIVTMIAALSDDFLANLPKAIHETYEPICMKQPNTVFLHMFDWFITKYGKRTTEDCEENRQRMAADWHPSGNQGPTHNPNATRANIMGGLIARMHKTILPSACGRTPPPPVTPSNSNVHSNTLQCHTTLSWARRNLRSTVHARPCPCRRSSLANA
jgi:hypothetical protein